MKKHISREESKERYKSALERHRLYLLAKNDYQQFKQQVGADNAARLFAELKKTCKSDTTVANYFIKYRHSTENSTEICYLRSLFTESEWYDYWNSIAGDAQRYLSGPSGRSAIRLMKLHRTWAFLSYLILLVVALFIGAKPWLDEINLSDISVAIWVKIGFAYICAFCFFLWYVWVFKGLRIVRWKIELPVDGINALLFIAAPFLIYVVTKYAESMNFSVIETSLYRDVSLSVIAVSHILLILDCMASLGCRKYYIGLDGILEGRYTAALYHNSYKYVDSYDDLYRLEERRILGEVPNGDPDQFRHFQFQPSASFKYIVTYVFVDIIHTACIILWMLTLITALAYLHIAYNIIAASISFAVMSVLLNTPSVFSWYNTNRFNCFVCKNLYAYKVSHLFRKLFYSLILLGASILLLVYCVPVK